MWAVLCTIDRYDVFVSVVCATKADALAYKARCDAWIGAHSLEEYWKPGVAEVWDAVRAQSPCKQWRDSSEWVFAHPGAVPYFGIEETVMWPASRPSGAKRAVDVVPDSEDSA